MQLVRGLENYKKQGKLHLALGNFDGVHKGHQMLVQQAIIDARENGGKSGVLIFDPHPLMVLAPQMAPRLLVTAERKLDLFAALGLDEVIIADFNLEVAKWSPEHFIDNILLDRLGIAGAYAGFNYNFGHKGAGDAALLTQYGVDRGFIVKVLPAVEIKENIVSSTMIRSCLETGEIELARELLGYTPSIPGIVVKGEQRGRTIGFPTANIMPPDNLLVPATGVYAAMIKLQGRLYQSVLNIGQKPTFHHEYPVTIEAHVLDYQGDFYQEEVEALLVKRLRSEQKFTSAEQLINQINSDIAQARITLQQWEPSKLEKNWLE